MPAIDRDTSVWGCACRWPRMQGGAVRPDHVPVRVAQPSAAVVGHQAVAPPQQEAAGSRHPLAGGAQRHRRTHVHGRPGVLQVGAFLPSDSEFAVSRVGYACTAAYQSGLRCVYDGLRIKAQLRDFQLSK